MPEPQYQPPMRDAYDYKMAAKDYSQDPHPNDWMDPQAKAVGSVAMQAQGMRVPQLPPAPIQQYPHGLSITQDPAFMNDMIPKSENRRSLRDVRHNIIEQQAKFEDNYHKPNQRQANKAHLDHLYFRTN